ncbi:putative bifunctional diguanylate cyclase/phosphodiesterase [Salaquimonas pukyongi]|uniref:putative bifunctional diguanylate cyclase/phosphodiesterase n=1 Tax=Salaquimonas pukyongi TaxID=2712698 RepID=UPI00313E32E2
MQNKDGRKRRFLDRVAAQAKDHNRIFLIAAAFFLIASGFVSLTTEWLVSPQSAKYWISALMASAAACIIVQLMSVDTKESLDRQREEAASEQDDRSGKDRNEPGRREDGKVLTLSFTDKTTGLGNKMRFLEKFKTVSQAANLKNGNEQPASFAVGVLNLDGMKPINDLYGLAGGDLLLTQCANRLRAAIEDNGYVFRYEGDEFSFILPDATSREEVKQMGRLLQEVLAAPFDINGSSVRLSASFGFALYPEAGTTIEKMTAALETALYHSKRRGRGRLTIHSSEIEQTVRENAILEQALRRAISDDNISPHYQPIVSLQEGNLLGFEALARWIDPELGFVSPAKFVPLAEERGIIAQLTELLLFKAAKTASEWPEDLFLSFNLSSTQLVDPNTANEILNVIEQAGLPPHRLEIEVTETAMMSDPETAEQIIAELHDAGVRVSMDDFGTGQSSLGRLRDLKLDKVKIDRAFVMALANDRPSQHIVRAILEMCAGLDLTVVAEGIEEIDQAENLKRYGCHAGQGYLFGKPQDALRTMSYIREFRRISKSDREAKIA